MKYHNITHDDMNNGEGLRVVLWVGGCEHHCKGCHNPMTWSTQDGAEFTYREVEEIVADLDKDYVAGVTFSGGDPLHPNNISTISVLAGIIKDNYPHKTVWIYTGYTWEEIAEIPERVRLLKSVDVLVDGRFEIDLKNENYPWAGSTNQRVIDVQKSLKEGRIILYESH